LEILLVVLVKFVFFFLSLQSKECLWRACGEWCANGFSEPIAETKEDN
jgi:hypothetical protein